MQTPMNPAAARRHNCIDFFGKKPLRRASVMKKPEENMNNTTRRLAGIASALLICLLAAGTASAYDADTACASLKEVVAGSDDLTALELVAEYSDGSLSVMKLWTESLIGPDEALRAELERTLEEEGMGNDLSRVILTLVSGEKRVSYELSPDKNVFVELDQPVVFPDISARVKEMSGTATPDGGGDLKLRYGLYHEFDNSGSNPFTFYARSDTDPATILPVMSAQTWILKRSGIRWVDHSYRGKINTYVDYIIADNYDSPLNLQSGTYKQTAHFQGYMADNSYYEFDGEKPSFTM